MKNFLSNLVKYGSQIKYYAQVIIHFVDMLDGVQDIAIKPADKKAK